LQHSNIPEEEFKLVCDLVYSCCALEQANTSARLPRKKIISLVGQIVNGKRQQNGMAKLDDTTFYRRVEKHNSSRQNKSNSVDKREARRVLWLKYESQKSHYENWEKSVIELGFARESETEEEREKGRLVFFDPSRIVQADEYSFTLNGNDEIAGGRPARLYSTDALPEAGQTAQKTSSKCTVMQAINFADEALPPFVIYPTKSTKNETVKLSVKTIAGFKQVRGKYGCNGYYHHDPIVAVSPHGSMNKKLWKIWLTEFIAYLYPDCKDVPGYRVLVKVDSGPGKD
jgi:hypothetical protein